MCKARGEGQESMTRLGEAGSAEAAVGKVAGAGEPDEAAETVPEKAAEAPVKMAAEAPAVKAVEALSEKLVVNAESGSASL